MHDDVAHLAGDGGPTARFPAGDISGKEQDGLCIYKGIPYAAPPTGEGRWMPPAPLERWTETRDGTRSGPACVQPVRRSSSIYASSLAETGEDCLYLDIWAPRGARDLPVLVWIHGGSFIWGAGSEPIYDGAALAGRGAVVVTINYRLGIFGYLAHPELSAESLDGVSGNYGLLDQIAALEWIRRNISAVGGDPENVTIAGESAGALSVLYLMVSPLAQGLFAKAIAQSAYMISTPALKERRHGHEPAEATGARLAAALGAADISSLRGMDAQTLADRAIEQGFLPGGTIDGHALPDQLVNIFERGEHAKVPLIAGFNSGEIRSLTFLVPPLPDSAEAYEAEIGDRYGLQAERFLSLYPSTDIRESALACIRDALYGWTTGKLATAQEAVGASCFVYYFDHTYPAAHAAGLDGFHGCELPYLFGTADAVPILWPQIPCTGEDARLTRAFGDRWIFFARGGDPDWPDHSDGGVYMRFAGTPETARDLLPGMFEFHEEIIRARREAGDAQWNWNVGMAAPLRVATRTADDE